MTRRLDIIFAIHLQTRGFAYVLFDESRFPIDWGVYDARGARNAPDFALISHNQKQVFLVEVILVTEGVRPDRHRIRVHPAQLGPHVCELVICCCPIELSKVVSPAHGCRSPIQAQSLMFIPGSSSISRQRHVHPPFRVAQENDVRYDLRPERNLGCRPR
jgi:hypothetical protein